MRVLVPLYAFGPMGHALYDADVHAAVIERTGPGWLIEFIAPLEKAAFLSALHKIGVHSFYRPRAWGDGSEVPPLAPPQARLQVDDAAMKAKL